jgi:hypothetical protein
LVIPEDLKENYEWCKRSEGSTFNGLSSKVCVEYIERIARAEAQVVTLTAQVERATDLVRYMRGELFDANLIDEKEYAALAAGSENGQRVARLEGYDKAIAEARKAVDWTPIDEGHLPKVGDELLGHDFQCGWGVETIDQTPESERDPATLRRMGWTHYRAINAPTPVQEAAHD